MNWTEAVAAMKRGKHVHRAGEQKRELIGHSNGVPIYDCGTEDMRHPPHVPGSRRFWQKSPHTWALLLICLSMAACGGGSTDTEPAPEPHKLAAFGDSMTYISAAEFGAALGVETHNAGVGSTTSSEIAAALIAYPDRSRSFTIWAGHNNFRDPAQVLADVAAMVAAVGHGRYVVLGMVYADRPDEYIGGVARPIKAGINATLAATYPGRYVEPAAILAARHNGTPQDLADVANGVTPTSLRAPGDGIHISKAAAQIIAVDVATILRTMN